MAKGAEAMSPAQIAECGQRIYDERYRKKYERRHWGKLVAINIDTGEAFVGDNPVGAMDAARTRSSRGMVYLLRVGESGAFQWANP